MPAPNVNTGLLHSFLITIVTTFVVLSGSGFVTEGTAQSRQEVDLEMEYFKINGQRHITVLLVETGENGPASLEGVNVELFLGEITEQNKLGSLVTNVEGKGRLTLDEFFEAVADSLHEYTFIARLINDEQYEDTASQMTIRVSALSVETFLENDKKMVKATFTEKEDTGKMSLVEWEELMFEVERLFGLLAVEEFAFTDENGEVVIEYPDDLSGDEQGNIVIVVRVPEHPDYGNVEIRKTVDWGQLFVADTDLTDLRTWMSSDPPIYFAFIFWGALIAAWGTIGYVLINIFKINKSSI